MIVVDASAMVELLLQTALGSRVESRLVRDGDDLHTPHLLDLEVVQALRRIAIKKEITASRAIEAIQDLELFDLVRHPYDGLLKRVWSLRDNLSAYDAVYVALAEALDATVVTCDGGLGASIGHAARVEVLR